MYIRMVMRGISEWKNFVQNNKRKSLSNLVNMKDSFAHNFSFIFLNALLQNSTTYIKDHAIAYLNLFLIIAAK